MELIDLSHFNTDYRHRRDLETALAWNAVKKTLMTHGRDELFAYIQSVKVTEKNITITTNKPIVNEELRGYSLEFMTAINTGLSTLKSLPRAKLRFL